MIDKSEWKSMEIDTTEDIICGSSEGSITIPAGEYSAKFKEKREDDYTEQWARITIANGIYVTLYNWISKSDKSQLRFEVVGPTR